MTSIAGILTKPSKLSTTITTLGTIVTTLQTKVDNLNIKITEISFALGLTRILNILEANYINVDDNIN